ncbi:MAG: YqgE/AlgH family protein [Longimicrobiales bacterium]|nr:YqgE/AlgH family protein [Longimicrobiales bacterium]
MDSLRGHLLISSGGLYDPNFRHTVVLIGEHGAEGAVGVVLNRPLDLQVADAVPQLAGLVAEGEALFEGGPVQPASPVLLAETGGDVEPDMPVLGRIGFLVGDLTELTSASLVRARVFAGYSGWAPGQLEAELEEDSWIVEPALEADVFDDTPETLWSRVLRRKGPEYRHLSLIPFDPSMN